MTFATLLAKHYRDAFFGGNWTCSDFREITSDISLGEALTQLHDCNTIATLTYHIGYYVTAQCNVLQGKPLQASDKESFAHPPLTSESDWQNLIASVLSDAEKAAQLIAELPDSTLSEPFVEEKYGTYFRNLAGNIEHIHYHLGQIALLKKLIRHA